MNYQELIANHLFGSAREMKFLKRRKKTGKKDRSIGKRKGKNAVFYMQMLLAIFYILKDVFV